MKRITVITTALILAFATGCLFPRYTPMAELPPEVEEQPKLTVEEAERIVADTFAAIPAGRHPDNPGGKVLGKNTTKIRLKRHNRTDLVLIEVMYGRSVAIEFYTSTEADARRFAEAVWRLRKEYRK